MYVHTTPSQSTSTAVVKKKDLGTYFIIIYQIFLYVLIQGPSKGSNSCNMIYIWFLFTPRKNLLNGENTKKCLLLLLLRSFKKYSETTASVVGFFFLSFFFLFLLLWFENWCVQNLLFLFLSLSFS